MSDEKQTFSAQELERLLNDLSPNEKKAADADLDKALEDILGRPVSTGSLFDPVPAARPEPEAAASGVYRAAPQRSAAPVQKPSAPVQEPAAPAKPAAQQAIPEQQRRPFAAQEEPSALKLDDNPLVNEDFRRFFTTSVTPDALFSSTTETGVPARRGHTVTQLGLNRTKPVQPVEEEEEDPVRPPREKGGFMAALRRFFVVEEEEEELAAPPREEPVEVQPQKRSSVWRNEFTSTAELPVEEVAEAIREMPEALFEAAPQEPAEEQPAAVQEGPAAVDGAEQAPAAPEEAPGEMPVPDEAGKASDGTVIFEKIAGAPAEDTKAAAAATVVFDPVTMETAAGAEQTTAEFEPQSAAAPQAAPSLFDNDFSAREQPGEEASAESAVASAAAEPAADPDAGPAAEQPHFYEEHVQADEEDYTDAERQADIAATLKAMVTSLTLRTAILAVLAFNALYFGLAAAMPALPQPAGLVASENASVFTLVVYLVSLLIGCGVSWPVFKNGIPGLWQQPSADSLAAVCCAGALVQNLVLLVTAGGFDPAKQIVYTAPALLALFANTLGKRMLARGVQKNFARLAGANQNYAVAALLHDDSLVRRITHGLGETAPCLLISRPAEYLRGFVRRSFSDRPSETLAQRLAQGLVAASVLAGFLAILLEGSFINSFAGVLCLGCPLTMVLTAAVPTSLMNKSAEAIGTVIPGAQSVEELGQANVVVADAKDLFPAGSVVLKGLKVFSEPRIDLALLYAASLLVPNCPTLRSVFLNIIQDRVDILPEIEGLNVEVGCGFEGWADSRHLLVGNRGMMLAHGVEVPPEDYELRYTKEGRYCPVYLAVNGRLYAMFVLGYRPDADVKEMLDEIYVSGLSLLVTSDDFNLTGERINTTYGIPSGCIKVLGAAESRQLAAHTACSTGCEGAMAHATSFKGFIAGIRIAANAAGMEKVANILQAVSVILTALLVLVLTCTGGLGALGLPTVLLYQLAWVVLILLLPLVKRY